MALSTEDLFNKAMDMSSDVEDTFLELGKMLRQLQDRDLRKFQEIIDKSDLGRRKAYYLVEVSRAFEPLRVSRARLRKIGWTKLGLVAKRVNQDNVENWLELCEKNSSKELERQMRGEEPIDNARVVMMHFSSKDYEELEKALLEHGGVRGPRGQGIRNKEQAIMMMVRKLTGMLQPKSRRVDPKCAR